MNRGLTRELFIGFRSTPILATLIFILGLCMALDYFVEPNEDMSLVCHADVYEAKQSTFLSDALTLDINRVANQIEFHIVYIDHGKEQAQVTTHGELVKVLSPVLTYEIKLPDPDLKHDLFLANIGEHIAKTAEIVREPIHSSNERKEQSFYIKVLEMDKSQGFVTIQLSERNALWACKIL